jgi:hypothetical protein
VIIFTAETQRTQRRQQLITKSLELKEQCKRRKAEALPYNKNNRNKKNNPAELDKLE